MGRIRWKAITVHWDDCRLESTTIQVAVSNAAAVIRPIEVGGPAAVASGRRTVAVSPVASRVGEARNAALLLDSERAEAVIPLKPLKSPIPAPKLKLLTLENQG